MRLEQGLEHVLMTMRGDPGRWHISAALTNHRRSPQITARTRTKGDSSEKKSDPAFGHADGRWDAELLHDQRALLSGDRHRTRQIRGSHPAAVDRIGKRLIHPMHVHGGPFEVIAIDGQTLAPNARYHADTVNVAPGRRYDVIWTARAHGQWLVRCHIPHHTTNNNAEEDGGPYDDSVSWSSMTRCTASRIAFTCPRSAEVLDG